MHTANKIPMVHAFLMTLAPNVDRDRLTAELDRAAASYDTVRQRGSSIRDRLSVIANALPDASEQERNALVTERMELVSEQAVLPLDTTVAARRFGTALAAWSGYVYPEIVREQARAAEAADALLAGMRPLRTKLTRWEESTRELEAHRADYDQTRDRLRALGVRLEPLEARAHEGRNAASFILNCLRDQFGGDFGAPNAVTPAHVERFVAERAKVA